MGITKTVSSIRKLLWWPTVRRDVKDYITVCEVCTRHKSPKTAPIGLLQPLPIPERPWSHLAMDFIVELPESRGNTVILTVIDRFSKMGHYIPLRKLPSAAELVPIFISNVVRLHGIPLGIVSDRGTQFVSRFWKGFCKSVGIDLSFSSAYHPQTNGAAERANQNIEKYLRCFISERQDNWSDLIPWAEYALNSAVSEATGHSPFFTVYGFDPPVLPSTFPDTAIPALDEHLVSLKETWGRVKRALEDSSVTQKIKADRHRRPAPVYQVGDRVWLSSRNIKLLVPSMKLAPRYIGPYKILRRINPVSYALALPSHIRIHNVFHVSLLKPLLCNRYTKARVPPPLVSVEGEEEFEVEAILDARVSRGVLQYLVDWVGYGPEDRSWLPATEVHAPRLVRAFYLAHPRAPGGRPVAARRGGGSVTLAPAPPRRLAAASSLLAGQAPSDIAVASAHVGTPGGG
uniref:Gypsy retrotransposon integrase-like protein 1 n=1 Tax=Leptobrachium leishanense TaxID=445787 RepID=A0A8C5PIT9_9ANUR